MHEEQKQSLTKQKPVQNNPHEDTLTSTETPARSGMDFSVSVSLPPLSAALFQKERRHTCWL